MAMKSNTVAITLLLLVASSAVAHAVRNGVYNVKKHGARHDGSADISQIMLSIWGKACASATPSKIVIPRGIYLLGPVIFSGPCRARVEVRVEGILKASENINLYKPKGSWITFRDIDQFALYGRGTLDGQGPSAWAKCIQSDTCTNLPVNIRLLRVSNASLRDITSLNSKHFHMCINHCQNLTMSNLSILAPAESPNTDGIHIAYSTGVSVLDSRIATGDDCVSIIHSNLQVRVERVTCGPGHGISIGSLGKYDHEGPVRDIRVMNCTFINTDNGVRVKTWPASRPGVASDIHFEGILMYNVSNPILIDQTYCPDNQCNAKRPSLVQLSNIFFKRIRGTSPTQQVIKLACSSSNPCEDVELSDIDLQYTGATGIAKSLCAFVKPLFSGRQSIPLCTFFS